MLIVLPHRRIMSQTLEPRREKTGFLHMGNKDVDQLAVTTKLISAFVFAIVFDSTIPILPKSEISSL